jgi:hypothetical protein
MSKNQTRELSDAEIEAILERRDRDERGEPPPPPELLVDLDDLRDLGELEPDQHFLLTRVQGIRDPEEAERAWYQAIDDLLDTDIPLSSRTRQLLKLSRLRHPDPQAEKRQRRLMEAKVMGADLDLAIALKRRQGISRAVAEAKAEVAKHWGRNSGEALDKALQPNRLNRRPRRKARRKGDAAKLPNEVAAVRAGTSVKDGDSQV